MRNFLSSQILTILMSWVMLFLFIFFQGELLSKTFKVFIAVYFWIPGFIALFFAKKEKLILPFFKKKHNKLVLTFSLALVLVFISAFFSLPFCEMRSAESLKTLVPPFLDSFSFFNMLILFILFWILTGFFLVPTLYLFLFMGHELLFSGYAWEKLKILGFWKASWIIGLYRGLWVSPLVLLGVGYPGEPILGVFSMLLLCILIAPIKIYLRIVSKTILSPALFFGFFLHFSSLFFYVFKTDNPLFFGMHGLTGAVGVIFINLILFLKTRKTPLLEYEL